MFTQLAVGTVPLLVVIGNKPGSRVNSCFKFKSIVLYSNVRVRLMLENKTNPLTAAGSKTFGW